MESIMIVTPIGPKIASMGLSLFCCFVDSGVLVIVGLGVASLVGAGVGDGTSLGLGDSVDAAGDAAAGSACWTGGGMTAWAVGAGVGGACVGCGLGVGVGTCVTFGLTTIVGIDVRCDGVSPCIGSRRIAAVSAYIGFVEMMITARDASKSKLAMTIRTPHITFVGCFCTSINPLCLELQLRESFYILHLPL
jgi:hypothetical protein